MVLVPHGKQTYSDNVLTREAMTKSDRRRRPGCLRTPVGRRASSILNGL
jgi:hypothetical protein